MSLVFRMSRESAHRPQQSPLQALRLAVGLHVSLLAVSLVGSSVVHAAPAASASAPVVDRTISVSGSAEVKVVPDQVVINLTIETLDKDLAKAKKDNDARVQRVLDVAKKTGISDQHMQTAQISVEPVYQQIERSGQYYRGEIIHYVVRRSVVLCLKDLTKFEGMLTNLLTSGATHVDGISFESTQLRKHRDEARAMATKAAKEKAQAIAGQLGEKLGRPRSINENTGWSGGYMSNVAQNVYAQSRSESAGADGDVSGNTFAPGQITISATINVVFDLAE